MRNFLVGIVCLSFCANTFASIMTLGGLTRSTDSRVISSTIGLDFMMWSTPEQFKLSEWEAELSNTTSKYFGWRIADSNEAFAMLKAANLPVYDSRQVSATSVAFDVPWSDACFDNDPMTVCSANERWGASFFPTIADIQLASLFFTGSFTGITDPLHNGVIFYNDAPAFQNSLDGSNIGAIFTHMDSGGYINASPSGYSHTDLTYLSRPLGSLAWRPLLVRDSVTAPDLPVVSAPPTALATMALLALLLMNSRRNRHV